MTVRTAQGATKNAQRLQLGVVKAVEPATRMPDNKLMMGLWRRRMCQTATWGLRAYRSCRRLSFVCLAGSVKVPGPPTKRGRPRTAPEVDPEVAARIRQHFQWIRDGMSIREGWRRWLAAGGPCDPRST
ncbi:MAG: hypothetical protein ACYTG0_46195, partial [Planctomycetota bacterium]